MKFRIFKDDKGNVSVLDGGRVLGPADTVEFIEEVKNELNNIKKEFKPQHQEDKIAKLQKDFNLVMKDWGDKSKAQLSELNQKLQKLEKEAEAFNKNTRNVTAEEVSVLAYEANRLKSKWKLISSPDQYEGFMQDLLESPEQVRQAFLDNAVDILTTENGYGYKFYVNEVKSKASQPYSYFNESNTPTSEIKSQLKANSNEIRNVMKQVSTSLLSGEALETVKQQELEISSLSKEYYQSVIINDARNAQVTDIKATFDRNQFFSANIENNSGPDSQATEYFN